MKINIKLNSYETIYELVLDMFCPNCGVKGNLFCESGEGDYYSGSHYVCINCNTSHYLDSCCSKIEGNDNKIVQQIKERCGIYERS